MHRTEIGKLEQGPVEPRLTTLLIHADALSVTIDGLVAGLAVPVEAQALNISMVELSAAVEAPTSGSCAFDAVALAPPSVAIFVEMSPHENSSPPATASAAAAPNSGRPRLRTSNAAAPVQPSHSPISTRSPRALCWTPPASDSDRNSSPATDTPAPTRPTVVSVR